jgi:8-oxo-dGTP pyrophosphatase MutT (NUDIX family)
METKVKGYGICIYKSNLTQIKILMCKSVNSKTRWGFLKGVRCKDETKEETAIREFYEESGILIDKKYLQTYFEQKNKEKDIGIYLINIKTIQNISNMFENDTLKSKFLCKENSQVKFIDIYNTISVKKKQSIIFHNIVEFLKRGSNAKAIN